MPFDAITELITEFAKNINVGDANSEEAEELKKTLLKEMFQS